jgi:hypothetical protein
LQDKKELREDVWDGRLGVEEEENGVGCVFEEKGEVGGTGWWGFESCGKGRGDTGLFRWLDDGGVSMGYSWRGI